MAHGTHIFGYFQTLQRDQKISNETSIKRFQFDDPWPFIDAFGEPNNHYMGGMIGYALHFKGDQPQEISLWLKGLHRLFEYLDGFEAEFHFRPEVVTPAFHREYIKYDQRLEYTHYWGAGYTELRKITEDFDPFVFGSDEDVWNLINLDNRKENS